MSVKVSMKVNGKPVSADIEDHEVETLLRSGQHGLLAARGHIHRVTLGFKDAPQSCGERRVVFYDEQSQVRKCYDFPPPQCNPEERRAACRLEYP